MLNVRILVGVIESVADTTNYVAAEDITVAYAD